jgi:hypothetical protein
MNNTFTQPQQKPTIQETRQQIVLMLTQMGLPVPPKPDVSALGAATPDDVHEFMHLTQSMTMGENLERLVTGLSEARIALDESDEDHTKLVEQIDGTLNLVSATTLSTSKTVLDLQEIEQELREAGAPVIGGYL